MRLTTYTDIGLRALLYLAIQPQGHISRISEVTEVYNVSRNHMVKVINQLTHAGLVRGMRGKGGGITLNRPAEEIFLGETIRLLEKHLDVVDCSHGNCILVGNCCLKDAFSEAMDAFLATLNQYTLADMVEDRQGLTQILQINDAIPA
ncbi:Rrf2 family transcriptional regulator [Parendozoicomonas sp. Alg238-R29]|uniref:Rrf2 family transcriptional regulator n=1 Tax=Parendozoicomonas sp. Alg238-R29 TaxID=2993446 RepID=UPI00248E91B4|nr:Rrf2 family transcriptional regulator [Parendozoicomonas sp. Alg238-R29]